MTRPTRAGGQAGSDVATRIIQVVEDDDTTREVMTRVLQAEGYVVAEAVDGREALEQLYDGLHPDLILLDMMLPGCDGWKMLEVKRRDAVLADIPVIIVTAISISSQEWATSLGARGLIHKPIDGPKLLREVERCSP
jgi:CheY-like chemotaxis protein